MPVALVKVPSAVAGPAAKWTLPGESGQAPGWTGSDSAGRWARPFRGLALASRPPLLPVSPAAAGTLFPCPRAHARGCGPSGSLLCPPCLCPSTHTLPLRRTQECPSFSSGQENKGSPRQLPCEVPSLPKARDGCSGSQLCMCKGAGAGGKRGRWVRRS